MRGRGCAIQQGVKLDRGPGSRGGTNRTMKFRHTFDSPSVIGCSPASVKTSFADSARRPRFEPHGYQDQLHSPWVVRLLRIDGKVIRVKMKVHPMSEVKKAIKTRRRYDNQFKRHAVSVWLDGERSAISRRNSPIILERVTANTFGKGQWFA